MFSTLAQIMEANAKIGHNWFSPDTMRFFNGRIHNEVYAGKYFISSEKCPNRKRYWTIRVASEKGAIDTVGDFQAYNTLKQAQKAVKELV